MEEQRAKKQLQAWSVELKGEEVSLAEIPHSLYLPGTHPCPASRRESPVPAAQPAAA